MTVIVYALRERGSIEPRYIGRTKCGEIVRFRFHISQAQKAKFPTELQRWLNETGDLVEQAILATVQSEIEAARIERETVQACERLGFRIFNDHLTLPSDCGRMTDRSAQILAEIEHFCATVGLPESRFGELALKDKPFVADLRAGRDVRMSTVEKIRAFMAEYAPTERAA